MMRRSRLGLLSSLTVGFLLLGSIGASHALCKGSLNVVGGGSKMSRRCPSPNLRKTWRIECQDACDYVTSSFQQRLTGFGACMKDPKCTTGIKCLPIAGSDIRAYNPPSLSSSILNRDGRYTLPPCISPACFTSSVNTMTVYCDCDGDHPGWWCAENDPLILSLDDSIYRLTDRAGGVEFDLGARGEAHQVPWTARLSNEAFLVLDRDGNGTIDDGTELFGDVTPQHQTANPNGFEALALYDDSLSGGNEDGRIDAADEIFIRLQLWIDRNHNGQSESAELSYLSDSEVVWIGLSYRRSDRVDRFGNEFRYRGRAGLASGQRRAIWNVFLNAE